MMKMTDLFQPGATLRSATIDGKRIWIPALPIPYQGLNLKDAWAVLWGRATAIQE